MGYVQWNITSNTTARDLLATSGTNYNLATAYPAEAATATNANRIDATKTSGIIESVLICNNRTAASTVNLYTERWDGSGSGGTKMYILNSDIMPAGTSIVIDTPIRFNRSTDGILASVENASDDITIYLNYKLNKKIS